MKNSVISFLSPKKVEFQGLWLGSTKAKTVYIFLHGLGGNVFSRSTILTLIAKKNNTAVLTFNNRGYGLISSFKLKKNEKDQEYILAGMAHEHFSDCLDDIGGAINYAHARGASEIILIGYSTGCQKIVYYLSQQPRKKIAGAILLAPMSDYAGIETRHEDFSKALKAANNLQKKGQADTLLPINLWPHYISAQRFLSLYTPDSEEEIFSYVSSKEPRALKKVAQSILVILAEKDEFADRPMSQIQDWFDVSLEKKKNYQSTIIRDSLHSFKDQERQVLRLIKKWRKSYGGL